MTPTTLAPETEAKFRESVRLLAGTENLQWANNVMATLLAALDAARAERDRAYTERNQAAQLAATLAIQGDWQAGWGEDANEPDWPVLYIDLRSYGQVSWHMPRADVIPDLPVFEGQWDGTDDKPRFIAEFIADLKGT